MARPSAISRLIAGLQRAPHDYSAPTSIFPTLSIDRLSNDLRLEEKGEARGKANEPPSDGDAFDDVEHLVIERIESEKRSANGLYSDQVQTYGERLARLNFESRFAEIQQAAPEAVSDFQVEAAQGRDQLFQLRRRVIEAEADRFGFRKKNGIDRSAKISSSGIKFVKAGFVLLLMVAEIIVNGAFLSVGSEQGLVGGFVIAFSFAFLNVVASFFIGLVLIRNVIHRQFLRKMIGFVSVIGYSAFAAALNLAIAHYREVSELATSPIGTEVARRLTQEPLSLSDVNSWVLFAIGLAFSLFSLADGIVYFDPYPGYERTEIACNKAHDSYVDTKSWLVDQLKDIKEKASVAMNDAARDLNIRRSEFDAILQARARLGVSFIDYQLQLERTAQALLSIYREANRRSRSSPAPARFGQPYTIDKLPIASEAITDEARDELRRSIKASQDLLAEQVAAVQAQYVTAVETYRQIDDMIPDAANGTTNTIA